MEVVIQALGGPQAAGIVKPILVYLGQLNSSGIDWKTDKELASLVKIGLCHVTDAAIREQPIPYEEWMTELVNIQLKYDNKEKVLDTVGKAFVVLKILGLAEGAPEDSLWNRLKALGDASPKEGSDPS